MYLGLPDSSHAFESMTGGSHSDVQTYGTLGLNTLALEQVCTAVPNCFLSPFPLSLSLAFGAPTLAGSYSLTRPWMCCLCSFIASTVTLAIAFPPSPTPFPSILVLHVSPGLKPDGHTAPITLQMEIGYGEKLL